MQSVLKKEKYDNSAFYKANARWLTDNNDKKAYETMWLEVLSACSSTIKKFSRKVPGIYSLEDIEEFALESAEKVMRSIVKNKTKVENLSNFVYLFCYGVFYALKRQKQNKMETSWTYETSDMVYDSFEDDLIEKLDKEMGHY
jgi:hypothetical protein